MLIQTQSCEIHEMAKEGKSIDIKFKKFAILDTVKWLKLAKVQKEIREIQEISKFGRAENDQNGQEAV